MPLADNPISPDTLLTTVNQIAILGIIVAIYVGLFIFIMENISNISKRGAFILFVILLVVEFIIFFILNAKILLWGCLIINILFGLALILISGKIFDFVKRKSKIASSGENIIKLLITIDIAICRIGYLVLESKKNNNFHETHVKIHQMIKNEIHDILFWMKKYIKTIDNIETKFSIFWPNDDGTFEVYSQEGYSDNSELLAIKDRIRHGENPQGIAGYAFSKSLNVVIPDLANAKSPAANCWVKIMDGEEKEGCIICLVIYWNVGQRLISKPMVVLNLTTGKRTYEDSKKLLEFMKIFQHKLETLIYYDLTLSQMLPKIEKRKVKIS
jgi:hypothetical protein